MPSVPLISASPSFSASWHRADPGDRVRLGGRPTLAARVADQPLAHQSERAVGQRGQVAGAAEAAVLVHHRGDTGVEHGHVGREGLGSDPGPAGGQGGDPQQHQRPDDLALDLGSRPGRMGADQAALQLGALLDRDVPGGQCAEAGGDAVVRLVVGGQCVR